MAKPQAKRSPRKIAKPKTQTLKSSRFLTAHKNFLPGPLARTLRKTFEDVYRNPRHTHPKRFLWDHWHLENQYRMHRTPARDFFTAKAYKELQQKLVRFGQDHLGCHSISEPWLSYYTEGDEQNLHTDSPHGPWAYVYSLTPWEDRVFSGGETLILKPEVLSYWSGFSRSRGRENQDLMQTVAPLFNQLLVFDPRLPHGVRRVHGVHDPRAGRLVVHGWFVNPEPYVTGALKLNTVTESLNEGLSRVLSEVSVPSDIQGIVTFRFQVNRSGVILSGKPLTNTLVDRIGGAPTELISALQKELKKMRLPKAAGQSELTLPLIFD